MDFQEFYFTEKGEGVFMGSSSVSPSAALKVHGSPLVFRKGKEELDEKKKKKKKRKKKDYFNTKRYAAGFHGVYDSPGSIGMSDGGNGAGDAGGNGGGGGGE